MVVGGRRGGVDMDSQYVKEFYSYLDIDRIINEGLGGGYIDKPYKVKQLEPIIEDPKFIRKEA
jgi:hypothetical protein